MNILVFSWRDPKHPMAGGAEQVMHEHMKGWVKAGHSVTLFSSKITDYPKREEVLDGVKIIRKGAQIIGVNLLAPIWYIFSKHKNYDLVVDQIHGPGFMTPLYVGKPKLAVLQEVARKVWLKNHLPFPINLILGGMGYILEPIMFLFYRGVPFMVGSNSAKEDLGEMGIPEKNITIVPHGVIIDKQKNKEKKEKTKTVVFLGSLSKDKGIEDAIKTFALLNTTGSYQFWIIGKGGEPYLSYLKSLADKLGLGKKLIFWGFVTQEKKFELLARAHVMVNPSIMEGWGLVNIEANAMGVPVVAYKSQGLVDSVKAGQSGLLIQENTPGCMANEVESLLENKKLFERLQKGAKIWSSQFSWENSRKKSLELINSLVQSS